MLSPKLDVIFQILFGEEGSERITKDLLSNIIDEAVEDIDLSQNVILRREFTDDKMGVVDVLAKINNNEYCNIELQMIDKDNIVKRLLYYWARLYTKGIKKSEEYNNLKRTVAILIANFELEGLESTEFHSVWKVIEEDHRKIVLTDELEIHIIELPKIYRLNPTGKDKGLKEWLLFLENPESKEVSSYMKSNENMKEAKEKLNVISKDEKVRRLAELRLKAIMDEKEAKRTGFNRGLREGMEKGMEKGIKEGREEGKREEKVNLARRMKEEQVDIKVIIKITELSKEEIEKL